MVLHESHHQTAVCLRLAGAFAKFQIAPFHRRYTFILLNLIRGTPYVVFEIIAALKVSNFLIVQG